MGGKSGRWRAIDQEVGMRSKTILKSRRTLRERRAVWNRLSELSSQLILLVKGYSRGGVAPDEAQQASKRMREEISRMEHLVVSWKLQREGRN